MINCIINYNESSDEGDNDTNDDVDEYYEGV